jgi:molybdopterin synthase catalytic subunit
MNWPFAAGERRMIDVQLIEQAFDVGAAVRDFAAAHPQSGGVVSFLGR